MEDQCHTHGKQSIVTIKLFASRSRYTTPITCLMPRMKHITQVHYRLRRFISLNRICEKITNLQVNRTVVQLKGSHSTSGTSVINGRGTLHSHRDRKRGNSHHIEEAVQISCDTNVSTTVNQTTRSCRCSQSRQVNPCIGSTTSMKSEHPGAGYNPMHTTK